MAAPSGKGRLRVGPNAHDVEVFPPDSRDGPWRVVVDGEEFRLHAAEAKVAVDAGKGLATVDGETRPFRVEEWIRAGQAANGAGHGTLRVRSPMSGRLVEMRVREGAQVGKGDVLFILEAMKMQNEVRAPSAGVVAAVQAKAGETLDTDRVVLEIHPGMQ